MSSNIEIKKFCEYCGTEFIARTTVTRYCGDNCSKRAYKSRKRAEKINTAIDKVQTYNQLTSQKKVDVNSKDFLTVKEVATLLSCSIRSVYYYIENGNIQATNLGTRLTRIKRSNIDNLFIEKTEMKSPEKTEFEWFDISEYYTISEIQKKFKISQTALQNIIKRENIPKMQKGRFVYVQRKIINEMFNTIVKSNDDKSST